MKTWTIVLRRSDTLMIALDKDSDDQASDCYVCIGMVAPEPMEAVRKAKNEARLADRSELRRTTTSEDRKELGLREPTMDDYTNLVVFEGTHQPALFGFVAGGQG